MLEKLSQGKGGVFKIILVVALIPILIIVSILALFDYYLCKFNIEVFSDCQSESVTDQPITDKEVASIGKHMIDIRVATNAKATAAEGKGENYRTLFFPSMMPGDGIFDLNFDDSVTAASINALLNTHEGMLKDKGQIYVNAGKEFNVNPALLISITVQESGWSGSGLSAPPFNNIGGITCGSRELTVKPVGCEPAGKNGTKFSQFASVEDSVRYKAEMLRRYYLDEGKTSIAAIGNKYAPIGADNDPDGVNNNWVTGVTKIMTMFMTSSGALIDPEDLKNIDQLPDSAGLSDAFTMSEAEMHIRGLMSSDSFAIDEELTADMLENPKDEYAALEGSEIQKTWYLAKGLKNEKDWTVSQMIMNARKLVYNCYLTGDECSKINKTIKSQSGGKYTSIVEHDDEGVLAQTHTVIQNDYKCVVDTPPPSASPVTKTANDGRAKFSLVADRDLNETTTINNHVTCGTDEHEELSSTTTHVYVTYLELTTNVLYYFEKYSLDQMDVTVTDKEFSYKNLITYYLSDWYAETGEDMGDMSALASIEGNAGYPLDVKTNWVITSDYGKTRTVTHKNGKVVTRGHGGTDFAGVPEGTPVYAVEPGKVVFSGWTGECGNTVVILNPDSHFSQKYCHMQKTPFVDKGDVVKQGDNIGLLGNTGTATTGAHLHLSYCAEESLVGGLSCSAPAVKGSVNDTRLHMSLPAEYESLSAFLAKTKTND